MGGAENMANSCTFSVFPLLAPSGREKKIKLKIIFFGPLPLCSFVYLFMYLIINFINFLIILRLDK